MKKALAILPLVLSMSVLANDPVWDGNTVELASEKLSEHAYAIYPTNAKELEKKGLPVATSGGFIVGEKGVLMIDTMLNKRLNAQAQDLIKLATDKPIVYAVNTSFHGDHSYGNMYLPEDTKIIQHENTKNYIDSHFEGDVKFMMQNFGEGRGIEDIKPTMADILVAKGSKVLVDLGGVTAELLDFGFAQTGGDLFVWEPESKTMWTGNPILTIAPAVPWLLDGHLLETLETLTKVYDFLPEDAKVVPGHGSVIGRDDVKWSLDYLTAVKTQVQAAIDEGLTVEQTVERVKLPEFSGYALYGWVHPSLNVPAAYKDLKGK
jgi:glyoxylase-like metal-dependent hydrolase (beta-lactamase superfamily II)